MISCLFKEVMASLDKSIDKNKLAIQKRLRPILQEITHACIVNIEIINIFKYNLI